MMNTQHSSGLLAAAFAESHERCPVLASASIHDREYRGEMLSVGVVWPASEKNSAQKTLSSIQKKNVASAWEPVGKRRYNHHKKTP